MNLNKLISFLVTNPCLDPAVLKVILFIRRIMEVVFIAVPIVLIVLITFDYVKNVTAGNEDTQKKSQKIVIKRLIYAVMLFFVLPIVNIVFSTFESSNQENLISDEIDGTRVNYLSCWTNSESIDIINSLEKKATFDPDGGKLNGDSTMKCYGKLFCIITNPPTASKDGYVFYGWSGIQQSVNCKYYLEEVELVSKETTFYACYGTEDSNPIVIETDSPDDTAFEENNELIDIKPFWWPIAKKYKDSVSITRGYESYHLGLDIKSNSTETGVIDIIAAYDGVVDTVWNDVSPEDDGMYGKPGATADKLHDGYGNGVIIKHDYKGTTVYSYYTHMTQDIKVKKGDEVTKGTVLGKMGNSGNSSGTHLHFEIRYGSKKRTYRDENDPLKYVSENYYPITGGL